MSESLIEEFETRAEAQEVTAEQARNEFWKGRHGGAAWAFGVAEQSVRDILTEEEARVLRELAENYEGQAEGVAVRKMLTALTKPEPEKKKRRVLIQTKVSAPIPTDETRVEEWAIVNEEWVDEFSTDNGKTWERVES